MTTESESAAAARDRIRKALELGGTGHEAALLVACEQLAHWEPKGICNDSPEEFLDRVAAEVSKLMNRGVAALPPAGTAREINLFGFGTVREVLTDPTSVTDGRRVHGYIWSHEVAEALGWDPVEFGEWVRRQRAYELEMQRDDDEESGRVGWDHIYHFPMNVDVWQGEGCSDDHYVDGVMSGPPLKYWRDIWLIHTDRLLALMSSSPWSEEFMNSTIPLMSYAMQKSGLEDALKAAPTYRVSEDGAVPTGESLADAFARDREGITEEEAIERAFRGPVLDEGGHGDA
jgi:hypothetical protein